MLLNLLLAARIARIQTQLLWVLIIRFRAQRYNLIQRFFQQFDIVRILCPLIHKPCFTS